MQRFVSSFPGLTIRVTAESAGHAREKVREFVDAQNGEELLLTLGPLSVQVELEIFCEDDLIKEVRRKGMWVEE